MADGSTRLHMIDVAIAAHPPADIAPWFQLARAQVLSANKTPVSALDVVRPLTEDGDPRVRYEAALVAADVLSQCNRTDEARDQLRAAEDLAKNVLYADPGVDGSIPAKRHDIIGHSGEERLWRDAESARKRRDFAPALASYRELISGYPTGRWRQVAVVQAGWCLVGLNHVAEGEKTWSAFIAEQPDGPWRGRALLALVDVALEARGEPALANTRCQALEAGLASHVPVAATAGEPGDGWAGVSREAELRRILLLLVAGDHVTARARAVALLAAGSPVDRVRTLVTDSPWYTPASGVGRLLEALAQGRSLTPPEAVIAGKDRANLHILLADRFILMELPERAESHLSVVMAGLLPVANDQRLYAQMRTGDLAFAARHFDVYRTAYAQCLKDAPCNPWAAHQSLHLAVDAYSRRGKEGEALKRLAELQQRFPDAHEAQTAAWYRGVIPYWAGRWVEADAAWTDLDRRYPGHEWSSLISEHYRPRVRAAIAVNLPPTMEPAKVDLAKSKTVAPSVTDPR